MKPRAWAHASADHVVVLICAGVSVAITLDPAAAMALAGDLLVAANKAAHFYDNLRPPVTTGPGKEGAA